jgi:hypothetical protein
MSWAQIEREIRAQGMLRKMGLVNQLDVATQTPRLSDVLFEKRVCSFASLAPLPSNVEGIEAALLFSAGHSNFVVLVSPSGWGKSHLLNAVEARLRVEGKPCSLPLAAEEYVENQSKHDSPNPLLLDDCHLVLNRPRQKAIFRMALERRLRSSRPTLLSFTNQKFSRSIRAFLPHPREWSICWIGVPEPEERVLLINQMAAAGGLMLSPNLVEVIAHQMHGNGLTLSGALKRLRLSGLSWLDSASTLRACGLLEPFFADNSSWDLNHKILKTADSTRAMFSQFAALDLAAYTMLKVACLSEAQVARGLGVEPAVAYTKASRFEREIERDPSKGEAVGRFVDQVVAQLVKD